MKYVYKKLLCIVALALTTHIANADKFEVNGVYYETDATNGDIAIVVKKPSGYYQESSYIIPNAVNYGDKSLRVEKIAESAFFLCSNMTSISLPASITEIERSAFRGCSKLLTITLPASLTALGDNVFSDCNSLESLIIPKKVEKLGSSFLSGCDALETLQVESGNAIYNSEGNCNAVIETGTKTLIAGCKNSVIPESVEYIGTYAFSSNDGLSSVTIPNSVKGIKDNAFFLCSNLSKVTMSESIIEIGNSAFRGCSKLLSIALPASLTSLGDDAFSGCNSLESLIIPKKVEKLGSSFLSGCDALETLQVESGNAIYNSEGNCNAVIETGTKTLIAGCKNSVIPESVEYIGTYAFSSNDGLSSVTIPNSVKGIKDNAFFLCSNLSKVTMSESIIEIGNSAFRGCSNLPSVILPNSLSAIGNDAFYGCEKLLEIVSYIENPFSIGDNVFYDYRNVIYSNAVLYVPEDKISAYKTVGGWKNFVNIQRIQPDPTVMSNGLTYTIKKLSGYAILSGASSDVKHAKILSSVDYDTVTYPVEIIDDELFANNSSLVSVTIPQSIKTIGQNILKDCTHLAAIVWECDSKPSSEFVSNIKNPNLLFYVSTSGVKPNEIRNVIVNGVAENIVLSDEDYGDFYCPIDFMAQKISYTHKYGLKTDPGVCQGWESIALPYDVQTYTTAKGEAKPYKVANTGERLFWLRELTVSGMVEAEGIKAYVPYIISMPNWEGYQDYFNIEGDVVFSSQNVTVGHSDVKSVDYGPRHFWPSFQTIKKVSNCFALNKQHLVPSETYHGEEFLPGSAFLGNLRDIKPFEAFIIYDAASSRSVSITELCGETTSINKITDSCIIYAHDGVLYIDSNKDYLAAIYNISGQLCKTVRIVKGQNEVTGLSSGIYLINGKKVVIQ